MTPPQTRWPPRQSLWRALLLGIMIIAVGYAALAIPLGMARDRARQTSCASSLRQIRTGILSYTQDYDDHLPRSKSLDEVWTNGVGDYIKNQCIMYCPSDPLVKHHHRHPRPRFSYAWNDILAGKPLEDVPNQDATPLVWDRDAWHDGKRNVMFLGGEVKMIEDAANGFISDHEAQTEGVAP